MNADPCGGVENENDGCGVIFPRMALDTVLCPLCKKLKVPDLSPEAFATLQVTFKIFTCLIANEFSHRKLYTSAWNVVYVVQC
jgi:hypothetical protein